MFSLAGSMGHQPSMHRRDGAIVFFSPTILTQYREIFS